MWTQPYSYSLARYNSCNNRAFIYLFTGRSGLTRPPSTLTTTFYIGTYAGTFNVHTSYTVLDFLHVGTPLPALGVMYIHVRDRYRGYGGYHQV